MTGTETIPPLSIHAANNEENTWRFSIEPPPAASPALCVPAPAAPVLPVVNVRPTDQDVPLYSSVHVLPPIASASFCVPAPTVAFLAPFNAPPTDQEVPLYSSVQMVELK